MKTKNVSQRKTTKASRALYEIVADRRGMDGDITKVLLAFGV